jgi:hypothetical protein
LLWGKPKIFPGPVPSEEWEGGGWVGFPKVGSKEDNQNFVDFLTNQLKSVIIF